VTDADLAQRIGHEFSDRDLLELALSHRSWCAEHPGQDSNERLEFLGDAVLGLIVTDYIYDTYPDLPEGELAKVRASVVSADALSEVALELDLGSFVRLGKGETASGGTEKPSILADALEAVLGAVYLDGGWEPASELVLDLLAERIAAAAQGPGGQDYKTRLQEVAAQAYDAVPIYVVTDSGPDHAKVFHAIVEVADEIVGRGTGRSKKQAEQQAARAAWTEMREVPAERDEETSHSHA
jgi:ribonuclease-3